MGNNRLMNGAIDKETLMFALLADEANISNLPKLFNALFKKKGVNAAYFPLNIRDDDILFTLNGLKSAKLSGVNIDAQYAKEAMSIIDIATQEAKVCGFVDTVTVENGKLYGRVGVARAILELIKRDSKIEKIAILGAGALARSILFNAEEFGIKEIVVYNNRVESSKQMLVDLNPYIGKIATDIERIAPDMSVQLKEFNAIINATPSGLYAHEKAFNISIENRPILIDMAMHEDVSLFGEYAGKDSRYLSGLDVEKEKIKIDFKEWERLWIS